MEKRKMWKGVLVVLIILVFALSGCTVKIPYSQKNVTARSQDTTAQGGAQFSITQASTMPVGIPINALPASTTESILNIESDLTPGQKLLVNGSEVRLDESGKYKASVELRPGVNEVDLKLYNSGGILLAHEVKKVTYEPVPEVKIFTSSESSTPGININGLVVPGLTVYINEKKVLVGPDGKFSYPVTLKPGSNQFKIDVIDSNGNQHTKVHSITFRPPKPTVYVESPKYNSPESLTIVGITEADNLLQVFVNSDISAPGVRSIAYEGRVSTSGRFSVPVTLSPGPNTVTVLVTSPYGETATRELIVNGKSERS